VNIFRQESLDAIPVPRMIHSDNGDPCTSCGWSPEVTEIIEIVVHSREDVRLLRERGVFDQKALGVFPRGAKRSAWNRLT
jgi:hypothetical protein